jgi:uncharacterized phage protein gp47/JayE
MNFGLSEQGLRIKRLADIRAELEIAFRASFGEETNTDPATSVIGQIIGIVAEREALLWELSKSVYDAFYPSSADGVQLDNIADLTSIARLSATKSTAVCKCGGVPGTAIDPGKIISVVNTGARFVSLLNDDGSTPTIGLSGYGYVRFESQVVGTVVAPAGSLVVIETPVTGWNTVINETDALVGRDVETDTELRVRRRASLQVVGAAAVDAIRARILDDVANVTDAFVYENDSDTTDGFGRPPHSVQVVVAGGENQEIAEKIWEVKAAGIATFGTDVTATVYDSMGYPHTIKFDRAQVLRSWLHIVIQVGTAFDQGVAQVDKVTVAVNTAAETVSVIINGRKFTATTGATKADTASALATAINNNANGWVPATAIWSTGNDYFELVADFPGCPLVTSWANETIDGETVLDLDTEVENAGDQLSIIEQVVAFAAGSLGYEQEQKIGNDLYRSRYFGPINVVPDIRTIRIITASGLESGDYYPTNPPDEPPSGSWADADITTEANEVAALDTGRVTVEIIP